ncbi:M20 family metallopeptidase [Paucibacter sp. KCTC 42545]|uniref:M20 family metallopeptidase n=1 Tax=Paucibacter sp. KCTC 42545 TaxID=1768242 RepID=UPI000733A344|nr:M20/M25/M40 family metallo-hydrolase [Paucibacter sp. KCTC 42545]ALT75977.1 peptidase M20 [Paucibacter sp. KCTC 42545]
MSSWFEQSDAWIDAHFAEEVAFLQALVQVPTDTPPGNNAPHARRSAELLEAMGLATEQHPVPAALVQAQGMASITNLIVRRRYQEGGPVLALNAHGDVVPPGEGWTHEPYGGEVLGDLENGQLYGRAAAVSKSDFASYTFALRALEAMQARGAALRGGVELHFTYDEEFGGELGPGWLLKQGLSKPDLLIAAGFSYQVITAHNGCLQMEVTVLGQAAHAAYPDSGVDALQASVALLNALYAQNTRYRQISSQVPGITHPYLNVGRIEGGSNTNVVPGRVTFKLDRRMIPEEDPVAVEADLRRLIRDTAAGLPGITVDIKRLLLAHSLKPLPGNEALVAALQKHGEAVFGEPIPTSGTPLYTDVRLYGAQGIPAAIYGAGPRTVLESNAKRADEHVQLADLRRATKVVARTLLELLQA